MKRKAWQGGLSLVELIVALTLLSGVLLMTVTVRFNFQGLVNMGMNQAILFLNTHLALDRIVSAIQHANYLEIDAPNSTLTLSRKVGEEYISSRYYRDQGGNLCYQPDLSASPLPSPEIVLPSVTGFQLKGFPEGGERFQMARVRLEAEDPQGIARRDALFQTAAFCRIFHGSYKPVRVVTRDSSGNVTKVKGSYDTIQAAIDAETTEHGDVVQVSSNDKTPYVENVYINKALIFEGGYDSVKWERHYADPTNPGQIDEAYETILNAPQKSPQSYYIFNSPLNYDAWNTFPKESEVVIDGFSISLATYGIDFHPSYGASDPCSYRDMILKIIHNKISNVSRGLNLGYGTWKNFFLTMDDNIFSNVSHGWFFGAVIYANNVPGAFLIKNNRIEPSFCSMSPIIFSACQGPVTIINNSVGIMPLKGDPVLRNTEIKVMSVSTVGDVIIANNSVFGADAYSSGGWGTLMNLYVSKGKGNMVISNNRVEGFSNSKGGGSVYFDVKESPFTFQNNQIMGYGRQDRVIVWPTIYSAIHSGPREMYPVRINNNFVSKAKLLTGQTEYYSATGDLISSFEMKNNSIDTSDKLDSEFGKSGVLFRVGSTSDIPLDFVVTRNYIAGGFAILGEPYKRKINFAISNNIFVHNTFSGFTCDYFNFAHYKPPYFRFSNNVIYNCKTGFNSYESREYEVHNSIFWGNETDFNFTDKHSGVMVEFNDTEQGVPVKAGVKAVNNLTVDPEFVDSAKGDFGLASDSPLVDAGDPSAAYYDPYDKVKYPTPNPATTPALPPAKGTIRNDIGAYGGPDAGPIGFVMPTKDDPNTEYIREDVIGTY